MKPLPTTIGRFELRAPLHDVGTNALYLGFDTTSRQPVVVQVVRIADPQAREGWIGTAHRLETLHHPSLATLLAGGVEGDDVYAAFAVAPEGETLESFLRRPQAFGLGLDQRLAIVVQACLGIEHARSAGVIGLNVPPGFIWITPALTVQIVGIMPPQRGGQARSDDDVYAMPTSVDASSSAEGGDVYTMVVELLELLTNSRPQRTAGGEIDLAVLGANRLNQSSSPSVTTDVEAQIGTLVDQVLGRGGAQSLDLAGFRRTLEAALTRLSAASPTIAMSAPQMASDEFLPPPSPPSVTARSTPPASTPLVYDENVQFTVYRPRTLAPGKWHPLLAFAHLSERRPDAPADEPDPNTEMARQASAVLGDICPVYRQSSEDSSQGIPRDGELTFVPSVPGIEFNPNTQSFLWTESVHRAESGVRARAAAAPQILHGRMSVYLGAILLAEINLSFGIGQLTSSRPDIVGESARVYRKIFASYSHRDDAIVRQCWDYAKAMGDGYLQDVINLRSGERWAPALETLIRDADVFQLFWSWNALQSEYVQNEWRYALGLQRRSFIRPVYWDDPLPARGDLPPKDLLDLHFQRIASWSALASVPQPPAMPSPTDVSMPTMALPSRSSSETVRMDRREWMPDVDSIQQAPPLSTAPQAPPRSRGLNWGLLSAIAAIALVVVMVPTIYRTTTPIDSGTSTLPSESPAIARGAAPPTVAPNASAALRVVVATENGPVLNASDDVRVQLIDKTTKEVVALAVLKADGTADFPAVPAGEYTIAANVPGLEATAPAEISVAPTAPATIQKVLTLRQRPPVAGRGVRGRAGRADQERRR